MVTSTLEVSAVTLLAGGLCKYIGGVSHYSTCRWTLQEHWRCQPSLYLQVDLASTLQVSAVTLLAGGLCKYIGGVNHYSTDRCTLPTGTLEGSIIVILGGGLCKYIGGVNRYSTCRWILPISTLVVVCWEKVVCRRKSALSSVLSSSCHCFSQRSLMTKRQLSLQVLSAMSLISEREPMCILV